MSILLPFSPVCKTFTSLKMGCCNESSSFRLTSVSFKFEPAIHLCARIYIFSQVLWFNYLVSYFMSSDCYLGDRLPRLSLGYVPSPLRCILSMVLASLLKRYYQVLYCCNLPSLLSTWKDPTSSKVWDSLIRVEIYSTLQDWVLL